ncbi:MAG: hypothetical protein IH831_05090, partial [Planctomycetes bacterium]|nr:hypothetical protein [Planctomycetota bacterium]
AGAGSTVSVTAGIVGFLAITFDSVASISGGAVDSVNAFGGVVNISGGTVGNNSGTDLDSVVNISGGTVGERFGVNGESVVNISGGTVGKEFRVFGGNVVNISGGTVGEEFFASSGSKVNLFGTVFFLNGVNITDWLFPNVPVRINDRDVALSGLLADGSPFIFDLNSTDVPFEDFFDLAARLTINLVSGILPGDYNLDGIVDGEDFLLWQRDPSVGSLAVWEANYGMVAPLSANSAAVPEPTTSALALAALCLAIGRRHSG